VLALLLAFRASSLLAGVGIGVLAGLATGLKLHGFIYMIPAAATALARAKTLRGRVITVIIGSACAVASALVPYLENGVSITGYLRFLRVELDSGFSSSLFVGNLKFISVLMVPLVGILIWRKPVLNSPDRWLLAALGISVAMTAVIGATRGAGEYHLLPLFPTFIYGIALVCESSKTEAKELAAFIFVSFFLGYGPQFFWQLRALGYMYQGAAPIEREYAAELKTILGSYPDAQIGISDLEHFSSYFYRVFSVWNGRPLDIDFSAWMDLAYVGVSEKHIVRLVEKCTVPTWILPLGTPFTMSNWYNGLPLLSESFRTTFLANYRQIESGSAYQVWKCKS
jgi:hypothetical protein